MSPVMRNREPVFTSRCAGLDKPIRGTKDQIVEQYEALSMKALREKDDMQARIFSQQTEHWRKV